jgi:DNA polymerase-1
MITMQTDMFPSPPKRQLLVVDGNNLVYRVHHTPTKYSASDRFGFMIRKIKKMAVSHAVIVWDPDDDSSCWRRKLWPQYKSDRKERTLELEELFVEARAVCLAENFVQAQAVDDEADDVIAAYVKHGLQAGLDVTIMSNDKDLLQLVGDFAGGKVRMQDDTRKRTWSYADVVMHFGVSPRQFVDYLALVGDSSDGYPGVPRIGEKTAVTLLTQHGSLEKLLEYIASDAVKNGKPPFGPGLSKSNVERLQANTDLALTCQKLATLQRDVKVPVWLDDTRVSS